MLQPMTVLNWNEEKYTINRFAYNSKTHSILEEKNFIPLYDEDLHFLIKRAGWLVTFIYEHFTFEQAKFKRDFVIGNQKARLKTISLVEKDFYKLLNNRNFGIDYCNNINNCILEPLYDDIHEI